jgi:hypothetical protein
MRLPALAAAGRAPPPEEADQPGIDAAPGPTTGAGYQPP